MGCCDKGKTHRREPKKREGVWKDLDEALGEAGGLEVDLANALTQGEVSALDKLVKAGGCPAGQHKHAPYDYCHPTERAHRGYTDEEPSGELDAAHGVIDTALGDARGMGAQPVVDALERIKNVLTGMELPEAKMFLKEQAIRFERAEQRLKGSPRARVRVLAAAHRFVKQKLKQAAMRLQPSTPAEEGERAGKADADIRGMSDDDLADELKRLKQYMHDKGHGMKPATYEAFTDRGTALQREARVRGLEGYGFGRGGPGPGRGG